MNIIPAAFPYTSPERKQAPDICEVVFDSLKDWRGATPQHVYEFVFADHGVQKGQEVPSGRRCS